MNKNRVLHPESFRRRLYDLLENVLIALPLADILQVVHKLPHRFWVIQVNKLDFLTRRCAALGQRVSCAQRGSSRGF